jgi:hypothetical protein
MSDTSNAFELVDATAGALATIAGAFDGGAVPDECGDRGGDVGSADAALIGTTAHHARRKSRAKICRTAAAQFSVDNGRCQRPPQSLSVMTINRQIAITRAEWPLAEGSANNDAARPQVR